MNNDDEPDTWLALEAATRNVVVLLRLRNESCGPGANRLHVGSENPWQARPDFAGIRQRALALLLSAPPQEPEN
jgi:hypothetical protein